MAVKTEDKRRRILSAALDCFEERGFAATRMEDIARSAGVAKGTIYLSLIHISEPTRH